MSLSRVDISKAGGGGVLSLSLEEPYGPTSSEKPYNGYIVKEIEGLGPTKATLVASTRANGDGERFHTARRESRNIIIRLALDPDPAAATVQMLRDWLYNFVTPKTAVHMNFWLYNPIQDQTKYRHIDGIVESVEPNIFSREPSIDISVMCYEPSFYDVNTVTMSGVTNGLSDAQMPPLDPGEFWEYDGTVETGFEFKLYPNRSTTNIVIEQWFQSMEGNYKKIISYGSTLAAGDVFTISTMYGNKYVTRLRNGVESSLLHLISPASEWLELQPGGNWWRIRTGGSPIPWTMEYHERFGGI